MGGRGKKERHFGPSGGGGSGGRGREGGGGGVRRRRGRGGPAEGGSRRGVWEKGSWGTKNEQNKQPKAPHTLTHTNTTKCWLKKSPPKLEKLAQVKLGLRSTGPSTIGLSGNWFQYDWPFSTKAAHTRPHVLADERNATRNACTAEENNSTGALCFLKNATHSRVVLHARTADVRALGTPSSRATWSSDTTAAHIAASTT